MSSKTYALNGNLPDKPLGVRAESFETIFPLLASQEVIRIIISRAPGHGHQSASVSTMKRLRELGFSGKYEIIYYGDSEKIANLFPSFDPQLDGPQIIPGTQDKIFSIKYYRDNKAKFQHLVLAVTGATDEPVTPQFHKADVLLELCPPGYAYERAIVMIARGKEIVRVRVPEIKNLPIVYSMPTHPIGLDYMEEAKANGIKTILTLQEQIESMFIYGIYKDRKGHKLNTIIRGLNAAFEKKPDAFKGPSVLLMSSQFPIEFAYQHDNLEVLDIRDPNLYKVLKTKQPGDIIAVKIGSLPKELFEYFFSHSSLPPTAQGANLIGLAFRLGKVFLPAVFNFHGPSLDSSLSDVAWIVQYSDQIDEKKFRRLVNFILAAKDPNSNLSQRFMEIHNKLRDRDDQVSTALLVLDKQIKAYGLSCHSFFKNQ